VGISAVHSEIDAGVSAFGHRDYSKEDYGALVREIESGK
jgi:hypothetical protein